MVNKIITILIEILKKIEKDNSLSLIGKGGTIIAYYYLNHRDSQDLDFDCYSKDEMSDDKIREYFERIFDELKSEKVIENYKNVKVERSGTGIFHMNVLFSKYKSYPPTKVEINFLQEKPENGILTKNKNLAIYTLEELFFHKLEAFKDRKAVKDAVDIGTMLKLNKLDQQIISRNKRDVKKLINENLKILEDWIKDKTVWKEEFRNLEVKFNSVNEKNFENFIKNTIHMLNRVLNNIK